MITMMTITTTVLLPVDNWVDKTCFTIEMFPSVHWTIRGLCEETVVMEHNSSVSQLLRDDADGYDVHDYVMMLMIMMLKMMKMMMMMMMMMTMLLPADDWLDRVSRHSDGPQGAPTPQKRVISTKPNYDEDEYHDDYDHRRGGQ